ncbi:hypothetical protein Glove_81g82 [Diversispora epigaea]|uniref:Uncharacterized protein n=1 Tax=Diversispora epigaea TaxID=1348612 RepID=A0A397JH30_9GLOM|nr:hypothetical protein Glove_81g82 [Diversispora epigaea]
MNLLWKYFSFFGYGVYAKRDSRKVEIIIEKYELCPFRLPEPGCVNDLGYILDQEATTLSINYQPKIHIRGTKAPPESNYLDKKAYPLIACIETRRMWGFSSHQHLKIHILDPLDCY